MSDLMFVLPPLSWPDTEAITCAYLAAELVADFPGVPVGTVVPLVRPAQFVLVERAGGPRGEGAEQLFDTARLAIQCWGATKEAASDLCSAVRDLMRLMPLSSPFEGGWSVYRVTEFLGPTYAPDTVEGPNIPRYLLTIEARFRAEAKG